MLSGLNLKLLEIGADTEFVENGKEHEFVVNLENNS